MDSNSNETNLLFNQLEEFNKKNDDYETITDDIIIAFKNLIDAETKEKIDILYEEIINDAKNGGNFYTYQNNLEFIYDKLNQSIENEVKLKNLVDFLHNNNIELTNKIAQAVKLANTDQQTIFKLKMELENAWRSSYMANQKEKRTRETLNGMKLEISNLSKLVEQGVGLTMGQEYNMHQIIKDNENLFNENLNLKNELKAKSIQIEEFNSYENVLKNRENDLKAKENQAIAQVAQLKLELQQEIRKREKLNEEINDLKREIEEKNAELNNLRKVIENMSQEESKYIKKVKDLCTEKEVLKKNAELQTNRAEKFQYENNNLLIKNENLIDENIRHEYDSKTKDSLINSLKEQIANLERVKDSAERKYKQFEENLKEVNNDKQLLEIQLKSLEASVSSVKKEKLIDERKINQLKRDTTKYISKIVRATNKTRKCMQIIKNNEEKITGLNSLIVNFKNDIESLNEKIVKEEAKSLKQTEDLNDLTHKLVECAKEIKFKEIECVDYEKKLNETKLKLSKMEKLYENVRSDRNSNAKNLLEVEEENKAIKKQLAMYKNQLDYLSSSKLDIENEYKKLKLDFNIVEKNRDCLRIKLDQVEKQIKLTQQVTFNLQADQKNVLNLLSNANKEGNKHTKEIENLTIQRSILGSQLVRRNDEISLLYEKIKLLQNTIKRGEKMYSCRLDDIKILKKEILRLYKEKEEWKFEQKYINSIRNELIYTEKELLNEKSKLKALEQLQETTNIHRWRTLQASDPTRYELIIKVQLLQKRLISKYEEVAQLQIKFQEKDKIFIELKKMFAKQYSQKTVNNYEQVLDKKTRELKVNFEIIIMKAKSFSTFFLFFIYSVL